MIEAELVVTRLLEKKPKKCCKSLSKQNCFKIYNEALYTNNSDYNYLFFEFSKKFKKYSKIFSLFSNFSKCSNSIYGD